MTYTLDWSEVDLGGSAVVSYARGAILDFTDKPAGATAALSCAGRQSDGASLILAEFEVVTTGSSVLTFDYHTSTEGGYDKLHVDVDGVSQGEWSGATAWTTHPGINIAAAGTHTIRFRYTKDGGSFGGQDRVWVALLNVTNTTTVNDAAGTVDTYDFEDGAIPAAVSTASWTSSTSEPITGSRSLRSPAAPADGGSYDATVTKPAGDDYAAVRFDWKVSSESGYDKLVVFPDPAAGNVPGTGSPSADGAPGWLDLSGTQAGSVAVILSAAESSFLLRYTKDGGGASGSDAAWIDNLRMPAAAAGGGTEYDETVTDNLGITDTVTTRLIRTVTIVDGLTITDTDNPIGVEITNNETLADDLDLTDTVTAAITRTRTITDSLAISDQVATTAHRTITIVDGLDLTDDTATSSAGATSATVEDDLGITDTVTTALRRTVTITDDLAVTDQTTRARHATVTVTDSLDLTDQVTRARATTITITDQLVLTDTAAPGGSAAQHEDVTVTSIVEHTRTISITEQQPRTITFEEDTMDLSRHGRDYYTLTITTDPPVDGTWQASFDNGTTWHDGEVVDGTIRWLIAGNLAEQGAAVAQLQYDHRPTLRVTAAPEIVAGRGPTIKIT